MIFFLLLGNMLPRGFADTCTSSKEPLNPNPPVAPFRSSRSSTTKSELRGKM